MDVRGIQEQKGYMNVRYIRGIRDNFASMRLCSTLVRACLSGYIGPAWALFTVGLCLLSDFCFSFLCVIVY